MIKFAISLFCMLAAAPSNVRAYEPKGFIKVCGNQFADADGKAWSFAGWNGYTTMVTDAWDYLYNDKEDLVTTRFEQAKKAGLTAVRIFGHGNGELSDNKVLQTDQGEYDEKVFKSLDYVVSKARKYNIRMLVSFTTNWIDNDGALAYARWAGFTSSPPSAIDIASTMEDLDARDMFWSSTKTRSYFKSHIKTMFNRNNTYNGIPYKDDWAIFAWGLFNEPRCPASQNATAPSCTATVEDWANEMFTYARGLNKKQLLTIGEEGFFAKDGDLGSGEDGEKWWKDCNPFENLPSSSRTGQDFKSHHKKADFAEFHLWPSNWMTYKQAFATNWLKCHVQVCSMLKMPCVLGEFGRGINEANYSSSAIKNSRNPYFSNVFENVEDYVKEGKFSGDMFWQWVKEDKEEYFKNDIKYSDSTFNKTIIPHANWMKKDGSGDKICNKTAN